MCAVTDEAVKVVKREQLSCAGFVAELLPAECDDRDRRGGAVGAVAGRVGRGVGRSARRHGRRRALYGAAQAGSAGAATSGWGSERVFGTVSSNCGRRFRYSTTESVDSTSPNLLSMS